ncbi:MAG TPA: hypothetical protein VGI78_23895 [Acetobacteraceae bacterium]|jgi:hypothetical protein
MRTSIRVGLLATLFAILCASVAMAELKVYYRVGSWDAFSGAGTDGRPVCGVGTTNPADNRSFSLRFAIGGDSVMFETKKPGWNVPAGTQLPVVMQIGLDTPWDVQGTGNGEVVEWTLDRGAMQTFDAQFRRAGSMTLSFPSGNEAPWTVVLNGSTAISNAFGRCVTDLTQRTEPQQPAPAPAPAGPTQPFGQSPAQQPTAPQP